jgi:hypothetical protein
MSNGSSRHDDAAQTNKLLKPRRLCNDTHKDVTQNILTIFSINVFNVFQN